jgi:hypothetical protein
MAPDFIECDREQAFLMPASLRDWVPEDHLVSTVLGAVEGMDLSGFYADYRSDGHGRPAYDPRMMVALLLYAYARGKPLVARDRARVPGGRRLPRDLREPRPRPFDDRRVSSPPRNRARGALRRGPLPVSEGGVGERRGGRGRRHEGPRERLAQR